MIAGPAAGARRRQVARRRAPLWADRNEPERPAGGAGLPRYRARDPVAPVPRPELEPTCFGRAALGRERGVDSICLEQESE